MDASEEPKADGKGGHPEGRARNPIEERTRELVRECRTGSKSRNILHSQMTPISVWAAIVSLFGQ